MGKFNYNIIDFVGVFCTPMSSVGPVTGYHLISIYGTSMHYYVDILSVGIFAVFLYSLKVSGL